MTTHHTSTTDYQRLVELVVKAEIEGKPRHELVLDICDTPRALLRVGFTSLKLIIKGKTIGKIFFEHALSRHQIERIPVMLENPQAIYASATHRDSVVVLTYEVNVSAPIVIPVARDRQVGRGTLVNEVVSMYGKTGPDPRPRWRAQGLLLWEHRAVKAKGPA